MVVPEPTSVFLQAFATCTESARLQLALLFRRVGTLLPHSLRSTFLYKTISSDETGILNRPAADKIKAMFFANYLHFHAKKF